MNYEPFLRRCKAKFPKEECFEAICNKIAEVFPAGDFSKKEDACLLFNVTGKIGKAQFFRMKKYVKELYDWLFEQGLATQEQIDYVSSLTIDDVTSDEEIRSFYFKDLDSALDFVRTVGGRCGLNDDNDLLLIKAIVILSWYGFDRSEMIEIKKADLDIQNYAIRRQNIKLTVFDSKHFETLHQLSIREVHRGFPEGRTVTYASSPYLMRTARTAQMNVDKVSQVIKRFNGVAAERLVSKHKFSINALQNNGIFYEVLRQRTEENSLTEVVLNITGCDRPAASWYKAMFERWEAVYYGGGAE